MHSALSATGDIDEHRMIGYQDLNGVKYLDALITTVTGPTMQWYVAILDLDDQQSPMSSRLGAHNTNSCALVQMPC